MYKHFQGKKILNNKGFLVEPSKTIICAWLLRSEIFEVQIRHITSKADKQQEQLPKNLKFPVLML